MNKPNLNRCPAPVRTRWGILRCVTLRTHCSVASHRRWTCVLWPMAAFWAIKPWWPNAEGRAADLAGRGRAINDALDQQDGVA